jgi:SAM-dependent methyltransferase
LGGVELHAGLLTTDEWYAVQLSPVLRKMAVSSREFLRLHGRILRDYSSRWVADPLNQWSRLWEYPFTYQAICGDPRLNVASTYSILDAGSGLTFFPFFLASELSQAKVRCCDHDEALGPAFEAITAQGEQEVAFCASDLSSIPFPDASIDCIACISVLEHTNNRDSIVKEFARVLCGGGRLILTIDISLDGRADISLDGARELLMAVEKYFSPNRYVEPLTEAQLRGTDVLSTWFVKRHRPQALPWRVPLASRIWQAVGGAAGPPSKLLAVYGNVFTKRNPT